MRSFLRDLALALRSRRVLLCFGVALVAGIAIALWVPAEQRVLGFILTGAMFATATIIGGLAIALAADAGSRPNREQSAQLLQLAAQLHTGEINVARIAARIEKLAGATEGVGGAAITRALDAVAQRLNAVENDLAQEANARAEALESELQALRARLSLAEDQMLSHAVNVEQLVRRKA